MGDWYHNSALFKLISHQSFASFSITFPSFGCKQGVQRITSLLFCVMLLRLGFYVSLMSFWALSLLCNFYLWMGMFGQKAGGLSMAEWGSIHVSWSVISCGEIVIRAPCYAAFSGEIANDLHFRCAYESGVSLLREMVSILDLKKLGCILTLMLHWDFTFCLPVCQIARFSSYSFQMREGFDLWD